MEGQLIAAIDVGSNAIRLLIAREHQSKLQVIENDRASIRLGGEVFANGFVSEPTVNALVSALKAFKEKVDRSAIASFRAIGTSAMREAQNKDYILDRIEKEAGFKLDVIDGDEEARLVYLSVCETIQFSEGTEVLVDIGGGSVELTIVQGGVILFSESLKMGTVRLLRLFEQEGRSPKAFESLVREYSRTINARLKEQLTNQTVERCIGTGGNLETFLSLREKFFKQSGNVLTIAELETILDKLLSLSVQERIDQLGLRVDRADVIVPAAIVLIHVLKATQAPELLVPGVGVKEGLAYELLQGVRENDPHFSRANLRAAAITLGQKYHFDLPHALCVSKLAISLFDQLSAIHGLDEEGKKLLEIAALLHDVGYFVSPQSHHKHSYYLIESASFPGLTKHEKLLVACIARYHRRKFPQENHVGYKELDAKQRHLVSALASILRLADGLDRQHRQLVDGVKVSIVAGGITLKLEGEGEMLLDRWGVKLKSDLFEHVFGLRVELV